MAPISKKSRLQNPQVWLRSPVKEAGRWTKVECQKKNFNVVEGVFACEKRKVSKKLIYSILFFFIFGVRNFFFGEKSVSIQPLTPLVFAAEVPPFSKWCLGRDASSCHGIRCTSAQLVKLFKISLRHLYYKKIKQSLGWDAIKVTTNGYIQPSSLVQVFRARQVLLRQVLRPLRLFPTSIHLEWIKTICGRIVW